MVNKEYIERLQMVISHLHKCSSHYLKSVPVKETFRGETVWDGVVEVFEVDHPEAQRCYAWATEEGQFTAVLGKPPVIDPVNAVKASIIAGLKRK